jgi:hypothetical protein
MKFLKFFSYLLFFIFALILFVPKSNVYYFAEKNLKKVDVIISQETIQENFLSLSLKNLKVNVKAIDAGLIKGLDITLLGVYNKILISDIELSSVVEAYLPSKIEKIETTYTLLDPLVVHVLGNGLFGESSITFNLKTRELLVSLKPSKLMFSKYRKSLNKFKKSKNGEYIYAKSF